LKIFGDLENISTEEADGGACVKKSNLREDQQVWRDLFAQFAD
jgi:hypothetical protein